jgi:hypothetical protein
MNLFQNKNLSMNCVCAFVFKVFYKCLRVRFGNLFVHLVFLFFMNSVTRLVVAVVNTTTTPNMATISGGTDAFYPVNTLSTGAIITGGTDALLSAGTVNQVLPSCDDEKSLIHWCLTRGSASGVNITQAPMNCATLSIGTLSSENVSCLTQGETQSPPSPIITHQSSPPSSPSATISVTLKDMLTKPDVAFSGAMKLMAGGEDMDTTTVKQATVPAPLTFGSGLCPEFEAKLKNAISTGVILLDPKTGDLSMNDEHEDVTTVEKDAMVDTPIAPVTAPAASKKRKVGQELEAALIDAKAIFQDGSEIAYDALHPKSFELKAEVERMKDMVHHFTLLHDHAKTLESLLHDTVLKRIPGLLHDIKEGGNSDSDHAAKKQKL